MWKKFKKNWRGALLSAVCIAAGTGIGLAVGLTSGEGQASLETGNVGVISVLPDTEIEYRTLFSDCGHTIVRTIDSTSFVGYTEEELAAFYPSAAIQKFSGEEIVLKRTVDSYCPEHYLLRTDQDGALCVYQTDPVTYEETLKLILNEDAAEGLSGEAQNSLKDGVLFDSMVEIDSYLESAGS